MVSKLKKAIAMLSLMILMISLSGCGTKQSEKQPETETVVLTMDNFKDYFKFTVFAHWDVDSFGEPAEDSWWIWCGWTLKEEHLSRLITFSQETSVKVRICYTQAAATTVQRDEKDWSSYSVTDSIPAEEANKNWSISDADVNLYLHIKGEDSQGRAWNTEGWFEDASGWKLESVGFLTGCLGLKRGEREYLIRELGEDHMQILNIQGTLELTIQN